jgi:serine/threonine protein kinase/Flp pilus assembly protein TadD
MSVKCPKCHHENSDDSIYCGKCTTPLKSPEDLGVTETIETPKEELTTGSTFAGRYQIIEELGKGGMGRVYKVLDKEVNAKVALKLIKPEIASDKKTIERFRNELKVARDIAHKNVCRMYHLGKEEGAYYITMEYVSGEDLKSFIRRSGLISTGKAISIANQVCEGLLEAHRLGVVHRDLKPQNIMIDKEGNARIMDFGIARSLRAKGITGSGVMIGTPEYMSPEQVEGKEADLRADIYSLGVILYEMVTGQVPFEGDTPFSIGVKQKSEIPRPPKEINDQIPEDLNHVILKCMEKDKEKRYQSVGELHSELSGLEKAIPTTERIVSERKPLTSREISLQFSLKKLLIPAVVIISIVIIGLILWQVLPNKKTTPLAPEGKLSLAVMYFENNTGDEKLDHWRKAIAELLITDLSQSKYLKVLGRDRLYDILKQTNLLETKSYSSTDIQEVATRGGVNHILQGSYVKAGDIFRINYTLQNVGSGEQLGSDMLEGTEVQSILSMVDDVTKRIKQNFRLSDEIISSDIDRDIETITTSSPEAYKHYIEAGNYSDQGDNQKAISSYKKAIALDPEFATAYRSMANASWNLGYTSEAKEYSKKAVELSDRLPERERYRNQADYYSLSDKTFGKAIEAYQKLNELYPDNYGRNNLGILYNDLEQWDKAIEQLDFLIQSKNKTYFPYSNIAKPYEAKGLYDKATAILEHYLENISDNAIIHRELAQNHFYQGKYELALKEINAAFSLAPTDTVIIMIKGDIYWYTGKFTEAEKEYEKLLASDERIAPLFGRERLYDLYLMMGRFEVATEQAGIGRELAQNIGETGWERGFNIYQGYNLLQTGKPGEALKEFEIAWDRAVEEESLGGQAGALYWKGLAYVRLGEIDKTEKTAEALKETIEQMLNRKMTRIYDLLQGQIELEEENYAKAIEYFKKAISLLPFQSSLWDDNHAVFNDPLALAYYKSGDFEAAQEEYEKITNLTSGRISYGDIYAKSFYMLGKIHEQQGDTAKAIEHYEKFLDLWKDADPGIAEVDDARKRVAGLRD